MHIVNTAADSTYIQYSLYKLCMKLGSNSKTMTSNYCDALMKYTIYMHVEGSCSDMLSQRDIYTFQAPRECSSESIWSNQPATSQRKRKSQTHVHVDKRCVLYRTSTAKMITHFILTCTSLCLPVTSHLSPFAQ